MRVFQLFGVKDALVAEIKKQGLEDQVLLNVTGCIGSCALGPVMVVEPNGVFYSKLEPADIPGIVSSHLVNGAIVQKKTYYDKKTKHYVPYMKAIEFFKRQMKVVLRNCGSIDYSSIEQYIANDGYVAAAKALTQMKPEAVIDEVKKGGLRGRGGGGFPTGIKWEAGRKSEADQKYIVCNADEGDPGAFMDRSVIEGDPHSVLEGMLIGGYAIGASKGFVYIRAEYPLAVERLDAAIKQAREYGLLGKNIFGSGFNFDVEIRIGAGSFVCGEETALMSSIEGRRGEPRQKPPFPFEKGLYEKPTIINNVETFANVPPLIAKGSTWFASIGTEKSKGTKIFALAGNIMNTGLVEVPMGITLGEIIYDIGGGIPKNKRFKAAQTGGPSGGCLTRENLNVAIDYDSLTQLGAIMGSGGLIIMDEDACMVDVARFFMDFVQDESCGKCTPCRLGTKRMLEILERITKGKGKPGDVELLKELGNSIKDLAICGLGQTAPNPVLSTIRSFYEEYEEHINSQYCRAGVCSDIITSPCQNACPAGVNVPATSPLLRRAGSGTLTTSSARTTRSRRSAGACALTPARANAAEVRWTSLSPSST
jgi:NADH-quinone oxidoreductase subunit F